MAHPIWPLFDVRVTTPRLQLVAITDDVAVELAELAARGIHDPGFMPFSVEWTDVLPPQLQRNMLQHYWRTRAAWAPAAWTLDLAVIVDGRVAGTTGLFTHDFAVLRTFETGSWLGREFQGAGLGTEMRIATLQLGFAGFGAERATTGAFEDNGPSLGVTAKLGYLPNGAERKVRRGEAAPLRRFVMDRAVWEQQVRRDDIDVHLPADVLAMAGL